ncbi:MAG: RraA family protein [Alphaproteobacteria bacterium]|nr:RraA family protein [Alphaproteobacteria bacterium]
MSNFLSNDELAALAAFDTPTICNALEIVAPERRAFGFNRRPLLSPLPQAKPVVGYARTVMIRSREPSPRNKADARAVRLAYYESFGAAPHPTLCVMQDVDGPDIGFGAFWGEVQSNVHKALGCVGVITDGAVRDIDVWAKDFFVLAGTVMPSHAHVDIVEFGKTVSVAGMVVSQNDLIHADRHGAVVIPLNVARKVPEAANLLAKREKVILDACKSPRFGIEDLRQAFSRADDIH